MTDKITKKADSKTKKESSGDDSKSSDTKATKSSEVKESSKDSDPGANYTVGERQKPVSKAYRDGWDRAFTKKKPRR
jgi:hypothetical protein